MPSEYGKDVVSASGTSATSEYSFYTGVKAGGTYAYASLTPEEKTLYSILESKVSYGGIDSLNKKELQSSGVIYNKANSATYQKLGERLNPVIVKDINEAQARIGSARLETTDHASNKKLPAGMYRDTGLNNYYFVIGNKKEKMVSKFADPSGLNTYNLNPPKPQIDPYVGGVQPFPKARTTTKPDDDLIFNSPDYQTTYEEVLKEISLSIIDSGDDIISNFSYESIDSLPDVDIEIKISDGEYLNAKDVIDKGLGGERLQSVLDNSESSEEIEIANKILYYLEGLIGQEATYGTKIKYFGKFNPTGTEFSAGVLGTSGSTTLDFYVELPDEYEIPNVNSIRVRFDPV